MHKIVLATGGTGGHIFPATALAESLSKKKYNTLIIADTRFLNFAKYMSEDIEYKIIPSGYLRAGILNKIKAVLSIALGTVCALKILICYKPNVVVGFGGYPSFPTMVAAKILNIPIVIHEPNSILGSTNKLFATYAKVVTLAFRHTADQCKAANVVITGTPIRKALMDVRKKKYNSITASGPIIMVIFGGSQGAKILSDVIPASVTLLPKSIRNRLEIHHQCREEDFKAVESIYKKAEVKAVVKMFFKDIHEEMDKAHVIVCRSGAGTISELMAVGRPSILIPFAKAADNHQYTNAKILVDAKAAWLVEEKDLSVENFSSLLHKILNDPAKLSSYANAAKNMFDTFDNSLEKVIENLCTKAQRL